MTCFEIDPNVRVRGNLTYAGIEDADHKVTVHDVGMVVEVREPEAGLFGKARIVDVDLDRRLVYLDVDWGNLVAEHIPAGVFLVKPRETYLGTETLTPMPPVPAFVAGRQPNTRVAG